MSMLVITSKGNETDIRSVPVCQIDRPASNAGSQPASTKEWGLSR